MKKYFFFSIINIKSFLLRICSYKIDTSYCKLVQNSTYVCMQVNELNKYILINIIDLDDVKN